MERTEALRRDPRELVPWAASIVSVALNYYTAFARPPISKTTNGWISRYAWGDDYHDLIKTKLESLLERINRAGTARRFKAAPSSTPVRSWKEISPVSPASVGSAKTLI